MFAPMKEVNTRRKAQLVLSAVQSWEHWGKIGKVAEKEYDVLPEHFGTWLLEYQRFMTLIILDYRGMGMYSADVDKIWHSHILYTELYEDFCNKLIGRMIHHVPNLETPETGCESLCRRCTDRLRSDDETSEHSSSSYTFEQAYKAAFGIEPDAGLWNIPEAEGIAM